MGAFAELLGFDGRINRVGYLWRSIASAIAIAILAAIAGVALAAVREPDGVLGYTQLTQEVMTGALLLGLWSSFALATRRLRDMGLEPAYIVPVYAALFVVNAQLLEPMSRVEPDRFGAVEAAWIAIECLSVIPLLFWPPHDNGDTPRVRTYDPGPPTAYLNWRESG